MPDQIYSVTWNGKEKVSYVYDGLGRLTTKNIGSFDTSYSYENVGEDKTTTLVKSVATPAGTYTYTYDNIGNILSVSDGTNTTSYEYDSLNQLVRVSDEQAVKHTHIHNKVRHLIFIRKETIMIEFKGYLTGTSQKYFCNQIVKFQRLFIMFTCIPGFSIIYLFTYLYWGYMLSQK